MSYDYSENILIQQSAGEVLEKRLGWNVVFAYNTERLGGNGTLGRLDYREILLKRYVKQALFALNPWMTDSYAAAAIRKLETVSTLESLLQANESMYGYIRDGVPVDFRKPDGGTEPRRALLINFTEPEKNHFLAVKEMKIHGVRYNRRTDIVGFVNGLPLLFVELKKQNVDVRQAYQDNYTDYLQTIPQLFWYNAFLILSNGLEAKVGTLGSKYEFFHEWKRLKEDEEGAVDLETMLLGICRKENFIDLLENFLLFDHSDGRTVKILARNHQYLGVNEAVQAYADRKLRDGKLGVFWHTQGSGKSYSMVFLARKIKRKFAGSPTIVVLTDRDELNKQISDTFEACGCLNGVPAKTFMPKNSSELYRMLEGNPSYIFTLIHKFNRAVVPPLHPDHDVILMSDEAHRTQNGIFADNMVKLLPTASRIGFTGTPLFSYDSITKRTFGGYISVYDFKRAVDDGATVPLYYENAGERLHLDNPQINDHLADLVEQASEDMDGDQRAKLEMEIAKEIHIITAEQRLRIVAKDFVKHYSYLWTTGKAMFVCVNKVTCVRMYNFVQEYWQEEIQALEAQLAAASQQEAQELWRKLDWMKETEMAVVISGEQNEEKHFANWGLDIKPHREKMVKRELDKEFKDPDNPFRIVFVCAMWLTGFDVKSLSCLYLDKPLKAHTLMQTIARANRVCEGKTNGLIIDYIGVVDALRQALADYTASRGQQRGGNPLPPKEELAAYIVDLIQKIEDMMQEEGFSLESLVQADGFQKLSLARDGANAMSRDDETRKNFGLLARKLFRLCKYMERDDLDETAWKKRDAISAIDDLMQQRVFHADNSALMKQINDVVSQYIETMPHEEAVQQSGRYDISHIDFDRLRAEFMKTKRKNLLLRDIKSIVEERLDRMMAANPHRVNFYDHYQKIIEAYNAKQDRGDIEKTFQDLMDLSQELDEETQRFVREGFENEEELAMYDLLFKDSLTKEEIKQLKSTAKELLQKVKEAIHQMHNWREKEETKANVEKVIRNVLYMELPHSYDDQDMEQCRRQVFSYVYDAYPAA